MAQKVKEWITVNGQHVPIFEGQSKQEAVNNAIKNQQNAKKDEDTKERQIAANKKEADEKNGKQQSNSKQVTAEDIKKKLISAESYTNDPEYKKVKDTVQSEFRKREEYGNKAHDLREQLKTESSPKPKSEWTEDDEFHALLGDRPMTYTEKGKQLEAEYDKVWKSYKEADHNWTEASERLRQLDQSQSRAQREAYNKSTKGISTNLKDEYEGFKTKETTTPYIDSLLKEGKAQVVEMSPQTYLKEISHNIFSSATLETGIRGVSVENVNKYMDMMRSGVKFNTPYLNYKDSEQEGRHRAIAAMMLGIERIPVIIVRR